MRCLPIAVVLIARMPAGQRGLVAHLVRMIGQRSTVVVTAGRIPMTGAAMLGQTRAVAVIQKQRLAAMAVQTQAVVVTAVQRRVEIEKAVQTLTAAAMVD
jgi:hypothetical protein